MLGAHRELHAGGKNKEQRAHGSRGSCLPVCQAVHIQGEGRVWVWKGGRTLPVPAACIPPSMWNVTQTGKFSQRPTLLCLDPAFWGVTSCKGAVLGADEGRPKG